MADEYKLNTWTPKSGNLQGQTEPGTPVMDENTFAQIRDLIYNTSGIYLKENRKYLLEKRLAPRLEELHLSNFPDYFRFLKNGSPNLAELKILFDAITINETSFFRNLPQMEALQNVVLPELLERTSREMRPVLRILSAGCSSGEEPYSIAMLIHKKFGEYLNKLMVEILGVDISNKVLQDAREAVYTEFSMRNIPAEYLSRYFEQKGLQYLLRSEIREMVKFLNVNLVEGQPLMALGTFDLIFCRNVLIYFDQDSKIRVVNNLFHLLKPGGFLFIGHSESLHGISRAFKLIHFKKAIAYKKET